MAARDEPFPGSSAVTYHAYCVARTTVKGSGGGRPAPATVRAGSLMILPGTRLLLFVFGALTFLAFLALFVMAGHTDRYFAWTIVPPVTAAFFGAAYAAGCAGVFLGLRSGRWAGIRVPYVGILVFTLVALAATLLHLDRFHFKAVGTVARFAAWLWLGVYVLIPVAMLSMLFVQERRGGGGGDQRPPLPGPAPGAAPRAAALARGGAA